MKCSKCMHYECTPSYNRCNVVGSECFYEIDDCNLVDDDGTINIIQEKEAEIRQLKEEIEVKEAVIIALNDTIRDLKKYCIELGGFFE